jgi:hypothetical protein
MRKEWMMSSERNRRKTDRDRNVEDKVSEAAAEAVAERTNAIRTYTTGQPIYIKLRKNDDEPARSSSSKGARRLEKAEKILSRSVQRMTRAINKGMGTYMNRKEKSNQRRRDGALVDIMENVAAGFSKTIARSSPILIDIASNLNTRQHRKRVRDIASIFGRIPFLDMRRR